MSDQHQLPGMPSMPAPVEPAPKLSSTRRWTIQRQRMLDAGFNPGSGLPVLGNGETCGSCAALRGIEWGSRWFKCAKFVPKGRGAHSPRTDIRKRWPACQAWEPRDAD